MTPRTHPTRVVRTQVVALAKRHPTATQQEIATAVGVTPQRVGQILREEQIVRKRRKPIVLTPVNV